eukprot:jgi/Ulvmu1/312/UM001_0316.1
MAVWTASVAYQTFVVPQHDRLCLVQRLSNHASVSCLRSTVAAGLGSAMGLIGPASGMLGRQRCGRRRRISQLQSALVSVWSMYTVRMPLHKSTAAMRRPSHRRCG